MDNTHKSHLQSLHDRLIKSARILQQLNESIREGEENIRVAKEGLKTLDGESAPPSSLPLDVHQSWRTCEPELHVVEPDIKAEIINRLENAPGKRC